MTAITENNANDSPKLKFPAVDVWIYKHRAVLLQNMIPFLSIMYGLGLLVSSGPSLSTILEDRGGMSLELSAALFVLAGAVRLGRAPGSVPPVLHTMSFFPWLLYTLMAIWSAAINGSAWSIPFVYGTILAMDILLFVIEFYGSDA